MRDFSEDLADRRASRSRRAPLPAHRRARAAPGGARDRGDGARSLGRPRPGAPGHAEMSAVRDDVELIDELDGRLSDVQTLYELAARKTTSRSSRRSRPSSTICRRTLDQLELRALFSGEHDERDAICEVHSGAGGTDAQDWAAMLLRMFTRWAETKGFEVEVDEIAGRPRGRHHVGDVHREGSLRVRHARGRARRAPPDPHLAVRRQRPPPDRVRVARLRARARSRPRSPRSTRAICASTRTARRARAVST